MSVIRPTATNRPRGRFSLIDLLVFVGIVVVLLALLLPMLQTAHSASASTRCQNRLREIGTALTRTRATLGKTMRAETLPEMLRPYLPDPRMWQCPTTSEGGTSFGFNSRLHRLHDLDSYKIVALDYHKPVVDVVGPRGPRDDWPREIAPRHRSLCHVLFYAGNVEAFAPPEIDPRVCWIHERRWRPAIDSANVRTGQPDCEVPADQFPLTANR